MRFRECFFQLNGCIALLLSRKKLSKTRVELIDRYWARLKLKMFKNQEEISENLTGLHALVRARTLYR